MSYLKNQRSPGDASAESEDAPNFEPYPVVTPPKDGLLSLAAATSTNEMEIAFSEDFEPLPYSEMEHYALCPQVADFLDSSPGHDAILGDEELGVLDNWQDDDPALPELSVENEENLASEVSDFKQLYTRLSDDSNLANVATEAETKDVLPCLSMCKSTDECPSEQENSIASANEATGPDNPSTSVAAEVKQTAPTTVLNNRAAQPHGQAYYYPWHYYSGMYHHPHTHLPHAGYSHYNQRHHAYNTQGYHHGRPYPPPQSHYYPRQGYNPTVPCGRYSKPLYMAYTHIPIPPQSYIKEVSENDVICGRGGKVNNHPGNKRFRQFIQQFKHEYMNETKQKKPMVALRVLELVKSSNPPGRFLIKFPAGYLECSEDRAREKASQALREGAAKLRKSECADDFSTSRAENGALKAGVKVKAPELPKSEDVNYWNDPAFCDDFNPPGPKVKEEDLSTEGNQEVNKSAVKIAANAGVKGIGTIETIELPSKADWSYCTDSIGDDLSPPCKRMKKEED